MNFLELLKNRQLLKLIGILALLGVLAISLVIYSLYNAAIEQHRGILSNHLEMEAQLFHTLIAIDQSNNNNTQPELLIDGAIAHMRQNRTLTSQTEKTTEFAIARREADNIVHLYSNKLSGHSKHQHILPINDKRAEAMRRALSGQTGTSLLHDYRNVYVLAAYKYIPEFKLGLVSKIDMREIFTPYLITVLIAGLLTIAFIFLSAFAFLRATSPVFAKIERTSERLRRQHSILTSINNQPGVEPCDLEDIFKRITKASSKALNVARSGIWMFDDNKQQLMAADIFDSNKNSHDACDIIPASSCPGFFKSIVNEKIITINDINTDDRIKDLLPSYLISNNIGALLDIPIMLNGECMGMVCHEHAGSERDWQVEDINFARSMADQVAMAINNCRRNQAEQALKDSEQRYELAVNGSNEGLWDWVVGTDSVYQSPRFMELLGFETGEICGGYQFWIDRIHPDDRKAAIRDLHNHVADRNIAYDTEYRMQTKSGEYRWYRVRGEALRDDTGNATRMSGSISDVTKNKKNEIDNYIQRAMLEHIYKAQDDFISGEDRLQVYKHLVNGILDITESEFGFIGEVMYPEGQPPYMHTHFISNIAWNEAMQNLYEKDPVSGLDFHNLNSLFGAVITSGGIVIANDPANDPRAGGLPEGHPELESFMGIPLKQGNKLTGVIGIANRNEGYDESILKELKPLLSTCLNLIEADRTENLRIQMENELRDSEEKANTVLETVIDGVITIDEAGTVLSYNHAAERIFGYSADEVINNNINLLMPEPHHSAHDKYLKQYKKTGFHKILGKLREVEGKRKDGTVFPLELSVNEIHLGHKSEFTGILRDISERKKNELALIAARDEAERANRAKSEFLSSMSHELRTPLNAIMGFAQLLEFDTLLSTPQKKHAREIYGAGSLLLDLINDVLDLAKIEAGHIDLTIEPIKLTDVLDDCIKLVTPQTERRNISIHCEKQLANTNSCSDVWLMVDRTRLKQILINLLTNAIKYNREKGSIYVSCPPVSGSYHRISISDSGRGISQDNISNLFQPFNRLGAERGDIEGTGIGLVITQKLVQLMDGNIHVESTPGKGTTFLIDLPYSEPDIKPVTKAKPKPENIVNYDSFHGRILIAEDNRTNQELLVMQLNTLGYDADVVSNGKEAIDLLNIREYELLLTDIHMPEVNGYQLTRSLRESDNTQLNNLPIIAITANAASDEATRCIEQGMNDYLSKPVDISNLKKTLDIWMPHGTRHTDNASPQNDFFAKQDRNENPIDLEALTKYVGKDPVKHRHFLNLFLETAPETIRSIHEACRQQTSEEIQERCHKLKSSARAVGANELADICQTLEKESANADWELINSMDKSIDKHMSAVTDFIQSHLASGETKEVYFNFSDVLVVDDDSFVLDLITSRLKSLGIEDIITASSGLEALEIIKGLHTINVVLLDLNMPGMDGVEFLRHLSDISCTSSIILISGEDTRLLRSAENIARDRKLNILGSLEKPVTISSLTRILKLVGAEKSSQLSRKQFLLTENDLRSGIENDELQVYYQPQIDLNTRQLAGVEALVRWIHPDRGMIPPDAFIPVAEEHNLINELTDIVLNKAMKQSANWKNQGLDIQLSLNISVDSLDRLDLPEHIVNYSQKHQVNISRVMLEITESRLMQDITSALDILTRLSLKGIGLSIDDFGTGYSSMEQLQRVPFKELKIDRSFVNGATQNKAARAILESSIELAQKLDMTIVAEGVETSEDWDLVKSLGCSFAQGYYMGKPMPGEDIIDWLDEWKQSS